MGNGGRLGKIAKWEMGRHKLRKRCLTVMGEKIGENGELMTDIQQVMYYVVIIWNSGRLGKIAKKWGDINSYKTVSHSCKRG